MEYIGLIAVVIAVSVYVAVVIIAAKEKRYLESYDKENDHGRQSGD